MEIKYKIKEIEKECLKGKISPLEAVAQIEGAIGGIASVQYGEGFQFSIDNYNRSQRIGLNMMGATKDPLQRLHALAVCLYKKAEQNFSQTRIFPGEVHIDRTASTKHHTEGIDRIYQWALAMSPAYGVAR